MQTRDADMTQGVIWKQLLEFAIPMTLGLLFQQFYNTVDTIVVGQFVGKEALAAVGSTSSIINMLVGLCAGLATGASVVISQCYGAHDNKQLFFAVHTTICITLVMGVVATLIGLLIVTPMLNLMATPADVFGEAKQYLTIYFAGVSGLLVYNMGSGILRAVGDSRRPLYFLCISAALNIGLDLLFVITFGMGIAGVAYATILSQAVSALLVLNSLTRVSAPYAIHWKHLRIERDMLMRIFRIGLPSGAQQALTSFSNVFVQSYINNFGASCMAGWGCYNKLDMFIMAPVQSIALAATTFTGQNYGANQLSRARKGIRQALVMSLFVTAVCSALMILADRFLLRLFTSEAEVARYGEFFITLISPFYVLICFNQVFAGALRGVGNARTPMLIMLGSFVAFRQLYLFGTRFLAEPFVPVALAYPMGWVVCSALMVLFYKKSDIGRTPLECDKTV